MKDKILKIINHNLGKIFLQLVINTLILFLILNIKESIFLYVIFSISLIIQVLGVLIIFTVACVKGSLINVTNNKTVVLNPHDMKNKK
jgi:hypothetical protein